MVFYVEWCFNLTHHSTENNVWSFCMFQSGLQSEEIVRVFWLRRSSKLLLASQLKSSNIFSIIDRKFVRMRVKRNPYKIQQVLTLSVVNATICSTEDNFPTRTNDVKFSTKVSGVEISIALDGRHQKKAYYVSNKWKSFNLFSLKSKY